MLCFDYKGLGPVSGQSYQILRLWHVNLTVVPFNTHEKIFKKKNKQKKLYTKFSVVCMMNITSYFRGLLLYADLFKSCYTYKYPFLALHENMKIVCYT